MNERYRTSNQDYILRFNTSDILFADYAICEIADSASTPLQLWVHPEFNVEEAVNSLTGPFLEIGGPTLKGFSLIDIYKLHPLYVSNIRNQVPVSDFQSPEIIGHLKTRLDLFADGTHLPFKANSLAGILVSHLPYFEIPEIAREAKRTLEHGGLIVVQGEDGNLIKGSDQFGLKLVSAFQYLSEDVNLFDAILQKP